MGDDGQEGLAAAGMGQGGRQMSVDQVVQAIMQGANPDDLLKMGAPQQVIDEAMKILMSQTQPPAQEGLAGMQVPQNDRPMRI